MVNNYNNLYTFHIDNTKFVLNKDIFNNYPDCLLTKILKNEIKDISVIPDKIDKSVYYIDRDPESFKYIIDHLRGYTVQPDNIKDINLRNKVQYDMKYFGLHFNTIYLNLSLTDLSQVDLSLTDLEPITNTEIINTPLLNQLDTLLKESKNTPLKDSINKRPLKELVNDFVNSNNEEIPYSLINDLSNNDDLKEIIKKSIENEKLNDSDTESLEL